MTPVPTGRVTRIARRAVGIALVAVLATGTAEATLRLLRYRSQFLRSLLHSRADSVRYDGLESVEALLEASPFHPKPYLIWGGFKLNSRGFRTPEYTRAKSPNVCRVIALGDSFTFASGGVPFDRMWHNLVGAGITRSTGRRTEVINLGVPGIGPRFSLQLFRVEGRRLAPDLVLFGLFVGNDFLDEAGWPEGTSVLERHSLLWRSLTRTALLVRNAQEIVAEERRLTASGRREARTGPGGIPVEGYAYRADVPASSEDAFLRSEVNSSRIFARALRARARQWVADVAPTVIELDRAVRDVGATLVVLIIPDQIQVDVSVRRAVLAREQSFERGYDFDWVQPTITERLTDAGIASVDVLPAFRKAPPSPRLYGLHDTHWSAEGNALAAAELTAFLEHVLISTRGQLATSCGPASS